MEGLKTTTFGPKSGLALLAAMAGVAWFATTPAVRQSPIATIMVPLLRLLRSIDLPAPCLLVLNNKPDYKRALQ
jgi:hypothetical protein